MTYFKYVMAVVAVMMFCSTATAAGPQLNVLNGHYYEVISIGSVNWDTARADAESRTYRGAVGHLATVTSSQEQDFLANELGVPFGAFIGGRQDEQASEPAGGWAWVTGEEWDYTNWAGPEPNNAGGNEQCLQWWTSGGWNDINCASNYSYYVIEYDVPYVPIPTMSRWSLTALIGLLGLLGFAAYRRKLA